MARISAGSSERYPDHASSSSALSLLVQESAGSAIVLTARPEDLTLSVAPSPVSLKAELAMSIPHGPNVIHSLALADGTEIRVTEPRDRAGAADRDGTQLFVGLDVTKLHAFPAEENQTPTSQEH